MSAESLPKRSKQFGVGKEIGGSVYVHRQYEHLLGEPVVHAKRYLPAGWVYTVVKWNRKTGAVTFVHSPDWDESPEPQVGNLWTVSVDGTARFRPQSGDPYIYHHKWLFVADDYAAFDVEESRARSQHWVTLPGVDRSRIGRRSYWERMVLPRLKHR